MKKPLPYIVEVFDVDFNDWIKASHHKNQEYADANLEVHEKCGRKARIVHAGKIIRQE
jgi:hypothetical protein